jgi:hypothetical protein
MIRSSRLMLLEVFSVLCALTVNVWADEAGGPVAALQGAWMCDGAREAGQDAPKFLGIKAVMQGDRLTWHFPVRIAREITSLIRIIAWRPTVRCS